MTIHICKDSVPLYMLEKYTNITVSRYWASDSYIVYGTELPMAKKYRLFNNLNNDDIICMVLLNTYIGILDDINLRTSYNLRVLLIEKNWIEE